MRNGQIVTVFTLTLCLLGLLPLHGQAAPATSVQSLWETRAGQTISESVLLDRLAQADVIFVGEQHNDPATHRLELRLLQGLHTRVGRRLTLGMEMWERDEQPALDAYLSGKTAENDFLKASRPWPNYPTDYRPLIEYAKSEHIPVIATNAPQAVVSAVGKSGLVALASAPAGQAAALIQAPRDDYWQRFQATMQSMGGAHGGMTKDDATIGRFYDAQVVRDETMAESITKGLSASSAARPVVLHINGRFHSDGGGGVPRRVLWRRPLAHVALVSVLPVDHLPSALPPEQRRLADYIIFVTRPSGNKTPAR